MTAQSTKPDNSSFLSNFGNKLLVSFIKVFAFLPFTCIYALSDLLYFLNKTLFKYRYRMTETNLRHAFPEKSDKEITTLKHKFYRHLFDLLMEALKLYRMSEKALDKRIVFKGLDKLEQVASERGGAVVLAFHHNNWEWCSYGQHFLKHPILMVYNPPRDNKPMENYLLQLRGRWGGKVIRTTWAGRTILRYKHKGEPAILWLAADQTAPATSPFWINFMNREAAFFNGPQVLAQKTNFPIFFQSINKLGRGRYEVDYSMLVEQPGELKPEEILRTYVDKVEEAIKAKPEYYLWSHNRWKHKRPENTPLID